MVFQFERSQSSSIILDQRLALWTTGATAIACLTLPFFIKTDRILTGMMLGAGTISAAMFGASAQISEKSEKIHASLEESGLKSLKQTLQGEAVYDRITTEISIKRRIADFINRLPEVERIRWMHEFGMQGLVDLPAPPRQQSLPTTVDIPSPEIANITDNDIDSVINPGAMEVLGMIAEQYPTYIRLDQVWVDELCNASVEHNMSKRANHHFYLAGGTQSGKSTLAGVLINKIASKSQGAATVLGSDPKNGVTRWLCKFSKKFDGMESLNQWITYATDVIDKRKAAIASKSGNTDGLGEIFLIQDEVDSVYGGGKGFPGRVDKKTAESLQALWNYEIKFTAGLKCHGIFMGQSPLSGATGFSRPELKNLCFLALGQTSSYILDNPKDFLNVKEEILQVLRQVCELLDKAGARYALVVPTRSHPFVALIPQFDIATLEQKQDSRPKVDDPVAAIATWIKQLDEPPTDQQLKDRWIEITGQQLNDKGVTLLRENLGI
jgi:hypothetical protein